MQHHQQRSMSTYPALLEPAVCRRRLPMPPDPHRHRRSSSPRILPTPPPLSPEYRCPSAAPQLERRPSGRVLPRPPTAELSHPSLVTASPISLTPDPTPDPEFSFSGTVDELVEEEVESPMIEGYDDAFNAGIEDVCEPPDEPTEQELLCSASPSIEQLPSANNSDCEDPLAHGLDPALYSPSAIAAATATPATSATPATEERECLLTTHKPNQGDLQVIIASTSLQQDGRLPSGLGLLHCSLQHFPVRKRLRVSLLKVEGLAGELKPEMEIHAICRVSIPGLKGGKEQLSEMKRGRDPVYNQEFFFDNVNYEELDTKHVLVGAYHQGSAKLTKDILIGEAQFPLREIRELNTKKEIRIVEEIRQPVPKKLGKIYTSTCIEKEAKRLTINLKKVDDLPRCGLTGAPDVCVRVSLTQKGTTKTKSSRVLKSTTTAVYNEAVMFLFSPTKNDLASTSITISVHDMQRSCTGNDTIGCSFLGVAAVDKAEIEQWKNTVEHMGKEYKATHHLKPLNATPPVRVAETGDVEEGDDVDE